LQIRSQIEFSQSGPICIKRLWICRKKQGGIRTIALHLRLTRSMRLTGRFVSRWVVLERFQRNLAENTTGARHSVLRPWRATVQLLQQEGIEKETLRRIETLRVVRNRIMHGTPVQDPATLQAALDDLESILNLLNQSSNPRIKAAMRWAQSGGDEPSAQAGSTS
jgi:hypothetical protein